MKTFLVSALVLLFLTSFSARAEDAALDAPLTPPPPLIGLGPQGFFLGTVASGFQLRLRGVIQADGRAYLNEPSPAPVDGFLIRRARPIIEGTVANLADFRLLPDFAGSKVVLFDAYLDVRVRPWLVIRAGKFKTPFSIERLQEEQNLLFIERGVPINLAPDRDIGLTVHGKVASLLDYEVGVLNGVPDNGESDGDFDSHKDAVGRLFVHPLARAGWNALTDFGIGVAATVGSETGTAANPQTPTYVTQGQLTAFTYLVDPTGVNTVLAAGLHTRVSPQMAAYVGPFGLLAEWIWDSQALKKGNTSATLIHRAGQVEATWVLTGERATYTGVFPDRPFTSSGHGLGAYELTARYGELDLDPNTFPTFADPTKSVQRIRAWAVGTNAYFTRNLKLSVNFERSTFLGGFTGSYRAPENALIARFQVSF